MSVEIVHNKDDLFGIRFDLINEITYLFSPVNRSTCLFHRMKNLSGMGLYETEDTCRAVSYILRVDLLCIARAHGDWFSAFTEKLVWFFVHTPKRPLRIIGQLIKVEDILHVSDKISILFRWYAPVFIQMRMDLVTLKDSAYS